MDCAIKTIKAQGIRSLFTGYTMTLLRDVPSFATYFTFYKAAKQYFSKNEQEGIASTYPIVALLSGGMTGVVAWIPCYPQDVIKSRIQSGHAKNISEALSTLLNQHGYRGLWKGFSVCLVRAFPANAATFAAYELVQRGLLSFSPTL